MEPPAQKWGARAALLILTLLGLAWLWHLDFKQKISTNVIDLIPTDERSPELAVVRSLVNDRQARTMLFALRDGDRGADAGATAKFAASLRQSHLFSEVDVLDDPASRNALGKFVYDKRNELLLPIWLARKKAAFAANGGSPGNFSKWLAQESVAELEKFVQQPENAAFQELIPRDPLLLVPRLAEQAQGLGMGESGHGEPGLIWALLQPSPFSEEGQQPVFDAIEKAKAQLDPRIQILWTGINRFAQDSRARISNELSLLNTLSLIAVIGVACVFIRKLWKVIHLVPVILFSVLGAWVAATAAFSRLHILVFVVGSLLTGVAIDYGFYLYMQPALRTDETYREKLRRLLKPLLSSCLTTVIGFSFLLFSELPLIRQLGVFVSAGLLAALLGAILYFAQLEKPFLETRSLPRPPVGRSHTLTRVLTAVAALGALVGLFRLQWRDDIRELEAPSPELRANDVHVRSFFGDTEEKTMYLTRGANLIDARESLGQFLAWHDHQFPDATGASLGWVIPSWSDWQAMPSTMKDLNGFVAEMSDALTQHGYSTEEFTTFFNTWKEAAKIPAASRTQTAYTAMANDVLNHLSGPLSLLASSSQQGAWFVTLAKHPPGPPPPAKLNTFPVSQLESLNNLFTRYRSSALRLSAIGLSLVGLSVFVLYGLKRGVRIFCIPAGSCVFAFGLLGLMGAPLNLFHLLGAFLGVCLSHNYAIFSAENADRREPPPPSIRLSALCTAASFGTLAFSHIPVVSALGTIVTLIVLTALLMVELEPVR
jgi:predicted exporter